MDPQGATGVAGEWAEQGREMGEQARERMRGGMQQVRQGAEQAAHYVQDAVEQARDKFAEYRDAGVDRLRADVMDYTRQQPGTALLIAAAAGLMVGWLTAAGRR
jgi:ElaB/YqjD/DUF883 family membrane-anchored ribosome-binding protein